MVKKLPERNADLSIKKSYIDQHSNNLRIKLNPKNQQLFWQYYQDHPYYRSENELINDLITAGILNQELHQVLTKITQVEMKEQAYQSLSMTIKNLVDAVTDMQQTLINKEIYNNPFNTVDTSSQDNQDAVKPIF